MGERPWVLSVQSFVVHGYVGNKCSLFAFQTLGIDVDPLCTVLFSNHTGYPQWRGISLSAEQMGDIVTGLAHPAVDALSHYTHVVSGYCRDAESLETVARTVSDLRRDRPSLIYLCDPVMGDDGSLYVPKAVADVYRSTVVRLADIVKLNQTEAEVLTGVHISDLASVDAALEALHAMGPGTVIISSCSLKDDHALATLARSMRQDEDLQGIDDVSLADTARNKMFVFGREADGKRFFIPVDVIPGYFSGTGDLFSALLLGWIIKGDNAAVACEKTVAGINCVLQRTIAANSTELLLVQSRHDLENPPTENFHARAMPASP